MPWVDNDIVLRARKSLAEHGFEYTPTQLRNDQNAMETLAEWSKPENQQRLNDLAEKLIERREKITDIHSLHKVLEEILGMALSPKEVTAWLSLLKIFL